MPGSRKSAEVVEANYVHVCQQRPQSVDAPTIAGSTKGFPVVNGIAPQLALRAEVIWRHAGDEARSAMLIQQEQLGVGPHIARVRGDEKRQIANQAHALRLPILLHRSSLAEEQ